MDFYDIAIIGGGPAGLTAALYASRSGLKTVLLEKMGMGGQAALTHTIDNYPGVPEVHGAELGIRMASQAEKFGVVTVYDEVQDIDLDKKIIKTAYSGEIQAATIVLSMGASSKKLGLEAEERLTGRGVSYCAVCDGAFFKGKIVAVVGGGNTAVEDALYLTRFVKKVYLIHRRDEFRASKILSDTVKNNQSVEIIWNAVVTDIKGENKVEGITVKDVKSGEMRDITLDGLFVAIGQKPKSDIVKGKVETDEEGYIKTDDEMRTDKEGVYAAGDIRIKTYRQIVTATSDGAIAALNAGHYLSSKV